MGKKEIVKEYMLDDIVSTAIKLHGVKVNRDKFLTSEFAGFDNINEIVSKGPVQAGVDRKELDELSNKLIFKRTSESSIASFTAGLPGGVAVAATLPADILQFFGMALRLAQEISYIYGAKNLWHNGEVDEERVKNQLILYCGVMFGVSSAVSGVRTISSRMANAALVKLPRKALTKTFWYPIIKKIGRQIGIKVTKTSLAHGVSMMVPIIGGIISGSLNFASMMPMAKKLKVTLDKACFDYSEEEFKQDIDKLIAASTEMEG